MEGLSEALLEWLAQWSEYDLVIVFAAAFLAATVVPLVSEVFVVAALAAGGAPFAIWLSASVGNTLGAVVNWWLGLMLDRLRAGRLTARWAQRLDASLESGRRWYERWGIYSLLLAWSPVGGDTLTFVAGIMRAKLLPFLVLVFVGKAGRYAVVVLATLAAL